LRQDLLSLAPYEVRLVLDSFYQFETRSEASGWLDAVAKQLIGLATPLAPDPLEITNRAVCPACGAKPSDAVYPSRGFTLPEGLYRHIAGRGNTKWCVIVQAAHSCAHDWWNR